VTLATGLTATVVGEEIYAQNLIAFSAYGSGADAEALSFTSPNDYFSCIANMAIDAGALTQADILSVAIRGNGINLYLAKWILGNADTGGMGIATIGPISVVLPPNSEFAVVFSLTSGTAMVGSASVILVGRKVGRGV